MFRSCNDFVFQDRVETAEVDRALTEKAGGTGGRLAEDMNMVVFGKAGTGQFRASASEKGNDGGLHGGGKMHGAGVIGEGAATGGQGSGEFADGGFSSKVGEGAEGEIVGDYFCDRPVAGATKEKGVSAMFFV